MAKSSNEIRLRVLFGVATALGFFSAFRVLYSVPTFLPDRRDPFGVLLALNLSYWYSWALLAPIVLWLARRFPLDNGTYLRSVPVHLAGVFVITAAHFSLVLLGRAAFDSSLDMSNQFWLTEFQRMFFLDFDWEMMPYWAILCLSHARRDHHQEKAPALAKSRLETRLMEAQLQTLQRQIQPHFLFNTLNTVSGLMHRDAAAADAMLMRLGGLLRRSIETVDVQEVALSRELDFVRDYVAIHQARFQDRLTVDFDIEPGTEDCSVPNFLLQPLVENGIRHGNGRRSGPGRVRVTAARVGGVLRLEVTDDGLDTDAGRLAELEQGVGVSNIRARLADLYGSRHRFAVSTSRNGGLSVQIELPIH